MATPPQDSQNKTFHLDSPLSLMGRANTKKIGRKIRVQLTKGNRVSLFAFCEALCDCLLIRVGRTGLQPDGQGQFGAFGQCELSCLYKEDSE